MLCSAPLKELRKCNKRRTKEGGGGCTADKVSESRVLHLAYQLIHCPLKPHQKWFGGRAAARTPFLREENGEKGEVATLHRKWTENMTFLV